MPLEVLLENDRIFLDDQEGNRVIGCQQIHQALFSTAAQLYAGRDTRAVGVFRKAVGVMAGCQDPGGIVLEVIDLGYSISQKTKESCSAGSRPGDDHPLHENGNQNQRKDA